MALSDLLGTNQKKEKTPTIGDLIHSIGLSEGWGVEQKSDGLSMAKYDGRTKAPFGLLGDSTNHPELKSDPRAAYDFMQYKLTNPRSATYVPGLVNSDGTVNPDKLAQLRDKWAPIGAKNDPSGLNNNWLTNVSKYLGLNTGTPTEYRSPYAGVSRLLSAPDEPKPAELSASTGNNPFGMPPIVPIGDAAPINAQNVPRGKPVFAPPKQEVPFISDVLQPRVGAIRQETDLDKQNQYQAAHRMPSFQREEYAPTESEMRQTAALQSDRLRNEAMADISSGSILRGGLGLIDAQLEQMKSQGPVSEAYAGAVKGALTAFPLVGEATRYSGDVFGSGISPEEKGRQARSSESQDAERYPSAYGKVGSEAGNLLSTLAQLGLISNAAPALKAGTVFVLPSAPGRIAKVAEAINDDRNVTDEVAKQVIGAGIQYATGNLLGPAAQYGANKTPMFPRFGSAVAQGKVFGASSVAEQIVDSGDIDALEAGKAAAIGIGFGLMGHKPVTDQQVRQMTESTPIPRIISEQVKFDLTNEMLEPLKQEGLLSKQATIDDLPVEAQQQIKSKIINDAVADGLKETGNFREAIYAAAEKLKLPTEQINAVLDLPEVAEYMPRINPMPEERVENDRLVEPSQEAIPVEASAEITPVAVEGDFAQPERSVTKRNRQSDIAIVNQMHPGNVEEAVLKFIADGGAFHVDDVVKEVGSNLKTGGKDADFNASARRRMSNKEGIRIDDFVHNELPNIIGHESIDEIDARNAVIDILSSVRSPREAREQLADRYRKFIEREEGPAEDLPEVELAFFGGKKEKVAKNQQSLLEEEDAAATGNNRYGTREQHQGSSRGENLPENQKEIRQEESQLAGDSDSLRRAAKEPEQISLELETRAPSVQELEYDKRIESAKADVSKLRSTFEAKKIEADKAILEGANPAEVNRTLSRYEDEYKAAEQEYQDLVENKPVAEAKLRESEQELFAEKPTAESVGNAMREAFRGSVKEAPALPTFGKKESAKFGGGAEKPSTPESPESDVPNRAQKFRDNAAVYTYELSPEGNRVGGPIIGRIITKDVALKTPTGAFARGDDGFVIKQKQQFIQQRNGKLIPVTENTQLFGEGHKLTAQMRGEDAPSTFIVGKIADEIAKSLVGTTVEKSLSGRGALGQMEFDPKKNKIGIGLRYENFADPNLSSAVIAHEIGHIVDLAGPHVTMERGNILGHVFALKKNVESIINDVSNKSLRSELINLSREWNPFEKTTDSYVRARTNPKELAADAVGAMLNNSELVRRVAPTFAAKFDEMIAARPEAKAAFDLVGPALHGDMIAIGELRAPAIREGFAEAEVYRAINTETEKLALAARQPTGRQRLLSAFNTFAPADALAMKVISEANKILKSAKVLFKDHQEYTRILRDDPVAAASYLAKFGKEQQSAILKAEELMGGQFEWPKLMLLTQQLRVTSDQQNARVHDWQSNIYEPLRKAGISFEEFGDYLEATAVIGNYRAGLANPYLDDPISAEAGLQKLQRDLGPDRYALIEEKAKVFRDETVQLAEEMYNAGLFTDETIETIRQNKDSYARFASALAASEKLQMARVSARGTVDAIQNPAISMPLQMLDMIRKLNYQRVATELVKQLRNIEGDQAAIVVKPFERAPKGSGTIAYYENGKRVEVAVDPWFADMYQYVPDVFQGKMANVLDFVKSVQRGVLIQYNPAFQAKNAPRDIMQSIENVGLSMMKHYYRSVKSARSAQKGKLEGASKEAYTQGVVREFNVSSRYEQPVNAQDKLLQVSGARRTNRAPLIGFKAGESGLLNKEVSKVALSPLWETLEAAPHLAAREAKLREGYSELEADYVGGVLAGTPDTRIKGKFWTKATSFPFMFANVQLQGNARAIRLARNPRTRMGFLSRALVLNSPQAALVAVASGAATKAAMAFFGDDSEQAKFLAEWERKFQYVPKYFLSNYFSVPISYGERNGKDIVNVLTVPMEETGKSVFNLTYPAVRLASESTMNFGEFLQEESRAVRNLLPNYSPYAQVMSLWTDYLIRGQNPDDPLYGNQILTDQEYKIAQSDILSKQPLQKMAEYSLRSIFGTSYRMLESWVSPERPFEFMGYYRQTRGGIEERIRTTDIKDEAATILRNNEIKKAIAEGDFNQAKELAKKYDVSPDKYADMVEAQAAPKSKLEFLNVQQLMTRLQYANDTERQLMLPILEEKVNGSRTLSPEVKESIRKKYNLKDRPLTPQQQKNLLKRELMSEMLGADDPYDAAILIKRNKQEKKQKRQGLVMPRPSNPSGVVPMSIGQ